MMFISCGIGSLTKVSDAKSWLCPDCDAVAPKVEEQDDSDNDDDDNDSERECSHHPKKEFNLGRFCAARTRVFHRFSHWEVYAAAVLRLVCRRSCNRSMLCSGYLLKKWTNCALVLAVVVSFA